MGRGSKRLRRTPVLVASSLSVFSALGCGRTIGPGGAGSAPSDSGPPGQAVVAEGGEGNAGSRAGGGEPALGTGGIAPGTGGGSTGGTNASTGGVAAGGAEAGGADGGCYRDPYRPIKFQPPCEQPEPVPNCREGWCTVEPGCFIMGSPWCEWGRAKYTANPVQVTLTHRFRIQQFEATQGQWTMEGLPNPSGLMANGTGDCLESDCPVGNVTWTEVLAFANLLSTREGVAECYVLEGCEGVLGAGMACDVVRSVDASVYDCPGYRLPTGAEWEYAARAATKTAVYTGDVTEGMAYVCHEDPVLLPIAWYCANAGPYTHPVGQKLPNGWGLRDVIGNAEEWAGSDTTAYGEGPYVDWGAELDLSGLLSRGVPARQTRGGGWNQWPNTLRVSNAGGVAPWGSGPGLGFRLAQTLQEGNSAP